MQEIERYKNTFDYDTFVITTDEGSFEILFAPNGDLYWRYVNTCNMLESPNEQKLLITKENYFLYELFYKLYESIKNNMVYYDYDQNDYFLTETNNLYKDGKIVWYSDELHEEIASKLTIEKEDEIFKVIFEKSKEWYDGIPITYSIRFRNSGSRYRPFNISFMSMYNNLKKYNPENHQIHIEEYLYKQKKLKK